MHNIVLGTGCARKINPNQLDMIKLISKYTPKSTH